ncbi:MAG: leucine-rich repeat domain-containing protein [Lachnospiraceae bacterium]|nr:leucine-rich repeat domain-containing protein [Lachnospiraceae bacterium]
MMRRIEIIIAITLIMVFMCSNKAFAVPDQSTDPAPALHGYCGDTKDIDLEGHNAAYVCSDEDGDGAYDTLRITGTGRMGELQKELEDPTATNKYYYYEHPRNIEIVYIDGVCNVAGMNGSHAETFVLGDSVTSIDDSAMYSAKVKTIIASNLKKIGKKALALSSLEQYDIPDTVTEVDSEAFYACNQLKKVTIGNNVKNIGASAFSTCTKLEYIKIPSNVKTIGHLAFYRCSSLQKIDFEYGLEETYGDILNNCESITEVILPDSLKQLYNGFSSMENVTYIYVPGSVKELQYFIASSCPSLKRITLGNGVAKLNGIASHCDILDEINLPGSINEFTMNKQIYDCPHIKTVGPVKGYNINYGWTKSIPQYAFRDIETIESVVFADTLTEIGVSTFSNCSNLKHINFPDSIQTVGGSAFTDCCLLEGIEVGKNSHLKTISNGAFKNCEALTSFHFPEGMESLADYAFYGCCELNDIYIPDSLTRCEQYTFKGCVEIKTLGPAGDGNSYNVTLGSKTRLPNLLMAHNEFLESAVLPETLTEISSSVFWGCTELRTVNIPPNVKKIESSAFSGCKNLESITIPEGVIDIEGSVFYGCFGLDSITFPLSLRKLGSWVVPDKKGFDIYGYDNSPSDYHYYDSYYNYHSLGKTCRVIFSDSHTGTKYYDLYVPINGTIDSFPELQSPGPEYVFQCWTMWGTTVVEAGYNVGNQTQISLYAKWYVNGVPEYDPSAKDKQSNNQNNNSNNNANKNNNSSDNNSNNSNIGVNYTASVGNNNYKVISVSGTNKCNVSYTGCKTKVKNASVGDTVSINGNACTITEIGSYAFYGCTKLKKITIGKNVKSIRYNAFYGCKKNVKIIIKTKKLSKKTVDSGAFNGLSKKTVIIVPKSKYKTYKKLFKSKGFKGKVKK